MEASSPSRAGRYWCLGLLAAALLTMGFVRVRLLDFPLERDEGEYAYAGQLILEGVPPYRECYNMKWPGTYLAYAGAMAIFGETAAGIHLGVLCVTMGSALLVFLIGRRIGGEGMGAVAGSAQALLEMNPSMLGLAGHATHFVVLPALAGIWLITAPWEKIRLWRWLAAGIFFGLACMMKQAGAVFGVFAVSWLLWRGLTEGMRHILPRLGCLVAGGLLPLLAMAAWLAAAGVWGRFWLWTIEYARAYAGEATIAQGTQALESAGARLWAAAPGVWLLAALGLVLLWWEPALRRWRFFLVAFALFSFLGVCPGLYFRPHYFLQLLPAAALLCGAAWRASASASARLLRGLERASGTGDAAMRAWVQRPGFATGASVAFGCVFVLAAGQSLLAAGDILFHLGPNDACLRLYGANPFPEALQVANYIAAHSRPDARIAVVGSEPEIYFYSHRRAATGYIYTFPLMEPQPFAGQMQREMIREIESAAPEYVVIVSVPTSWLRRTDSDLTILNWSVRYCRDQMQLDAVVELLGGDPTAQHWNLNGRGIIPRTRYLLEVYRRKVAPQ